MQNAARRMNRGACHRDEAALPARHVDLEPQLPVVDVVPLPVIGEAVRFPDDADALPEGLTSV